MALKTEEKTYKLTDGIYSLASVSGLIRELDQIENKLLQASVKDKSDDKIAPSPLLSGFLEENNIKLEDQKSVGSIKQFFKDVREKAPLVHISFASDPPADFVQKIINWFRREVNPLIILSIGLQPTIGAGCIVRTTNKQFDLSLGEEFHKQKQYLINKFSLSAKETGEANFIPVQMAPKEAEV